VVINRIHLDTTGSLLYSFYFLDEQLLISIERRKSELIIY
jgi:hypothetical protein